MIKQLPALGWNAWNSFGCKVSDKLIREMVDVFVERGYKDAGYEYVCIDDGWSLMERDSHGKLVPDPEKFPHGMKALADYVHSKGLKLGIYSCAGVLTCAGYPGGYGHEYSDAQQYCEWGVDLLKYDFCYFPENANARTAYLTMSMALRAVDRDILLYACNWGRCNPEKWMNEVGVHMYRTDVDIHDTYVSFRDIALRHLNNMRNKSAACQPDIDMLTVGMYGGGFLSNCVNEEERNRNNDEMYHEYVTQFAYWCFVGAPLLMGGDLSNIDDRCRNLLCHKELLRLDQDAECRAPALVNGYGKENGAPDAFVLMRILENDEVAIGFFNFKDDNIDMRVLMADCGLPYYSGYGLKLRDIIEEKDIGIVKDCLRVTSVAAHGCRIFRGKVVKADDAEATICMKI